MHASKFLFGTLVVMLSAPSVAQTGSCSADFINALKTTYHSVQSGVVSEALYEAACNEEQNQQRTDFSLSVEGYGDVGFSQGGNTVKLACLTKDRQFFQRHQSELLMSFLPPEAAPILEACLNGLFVSARQDGNTVSIMARYRPPERAEPATVESFTVNPEGALQCPSRHDLRRGGEIHPAGQISSCTRSNSNDVITVTISTNRGSKAVFLYPEALVECRSHRVIYQIEGSPGNYPYYRCYIDGRAQAIQYDCRTHKTCNSVIAIQGWCIVRHGSGSCRVTNLPNGGVREIVMKDAWGARDLGANKFQCLRNGREFGNPQDCVAPGGINMCGNLDAYAGHCAGTYHGVHGTAMQHIVTEPRR